MAYTCSTSDILRKILKKFSTAIYSQMRNKEEQVRNNKVLLKESAYMDTT